MRPHEGVLYSAKSLPHPHLGLVKPLNPINVPPFFDPEILMAVSSHSFELVKA
jgi:hypothetical protein